MTDKELDDYMKTVDTNFSSHLEKGTIEMSNEYYNLLEEKMARLINQNQELKKQDEKLDKKLFLTKNELDMREKSIDNKLNQQKEFIKYLEDMLDDENDIFLVVRVKDVLQKYKSIIGGNKDETNSN